MSTAQAAPARPWTRSALLVYLESLGFRDIQQLREIDLTATGLPALKAFGYGRPVLLDFRSMGLPHQLVLHTSSSDPFGHDRPSDRAASHLLAHHTFNTLPRHVTSLDVGAFVGEDRMVSLGRAGEFFLLTEFAPGHLYAHDLERIRRSGAAAPTDVQRARLLAHYLAGIHGTKHDAPALYQRRIRDLVGHGEGIMGLADSYPTRRDPGLANLLRDVEHAAIDWRWRLRDRTHRLSQVHGDFHPFNILFDAVGTFRLLDRSRGAWGEPADDVTALGINYLFFAVLGEARFGGPLRALFDLFWDAYLERSGDEECLTAAPPFLAWRGLVIASPIWYPSLDDATRRRLLRLVRNVLAAPRFDPAEVDRYMEEPRP